MQIWHHLVAFLFLFLVLISNPTYIYISVIISLIEKTILVALLIDLIISILDYIIILKKKIRIEFGQYPNPTW